MAETQLVPRKMGRPATISLDPAIKERILEYVEQGNYIETVFRAAGISDENFWQWQDKAERGDPLFVEFMRLLKIAEAKAEMESVAKMKASGQQFVGNATFLERRHRDRWGRSEKRQVEATVNITVASVNYNQLLKQIKK